MHLPGSPTLPRRLHRPQVDSEFVEVLCDESGRLGPLSYKVPPGLSLRLGDAVRVPFGRSERYGMVVAPGDGSKATREVIECFGPRTGETELALAAALAEEHFVPFTTIAPRLAPRTRRGNPPLSLPSPSLRPGPSAADLLLPEHATENRRILALSPGVDPVRVAALEALRLSALGQVLVLCPTKKAVAAVLSEFMSGAARMDEVPAPNEPSPWRGFLDGTLQIAVSTRVSALWPAADLAGIVVLDESHPGHLEAAQPHTNARDVAIRRTAATGAALVLLSSVPSLHALASRSKLFQVGSPESWPAVLFASRRDLEPKDRMSPPVALAAVSSARRSRHPAFVLAPQDKTSYRCRSCKLLHATAAPACSRCNGSVQPSGFGPDRVATLFTKATPLTFSELIAHSPRPGSTVVIFDADFHDASADLSPSWTIASVLYAAARLAGPSGTVVVCSESNPPVTALDLLSRKDQRRHARRVWAEARAASLPPFCKQVSCRFKRQTAPRTENLPGRVLGPRRLADGEWELNILLPVEDLPRLKPYLDAARRRGKVRITVS